MIADSIAVGTHEPTERSMRTLTIVTTLVPPPYMERPYELKPPTLVLRPTMPGDERCIVIPGVSKNNLKTSYSFT